MADLKTDFKDDVLNTEVNDKRRYRMIQNSDGTVSFEDVTDYLTVGDDFGSAEVNEITGAINGLNNNIVITKSDIPTATSNILALSGKYYVKNGICHLTAEFTLVDGLGQAAILLTDLPKAKETWYCSGACNNGYAINLAVGTDGSLSKYYSNIIGSQRVDMSVSYPVAE